MTINGALYAFSQEAFSVDSNLTQFVEVEEFVRQLRAIKDIELVVAVDIATGPASAPSTTVHHYFSTHAFTTRPSDSPANTHFAERIRRASTARTVLAGENGQLTNGLADAQGQIDLINSDGELDDLSSDYFVDGRLVSIKVAAVTNGVVPAYSTFTQAFIGRAGPWQFQGDTLNLTLGGLSAPKRTLQGGKTSRLKTSIHGRFYSGEGSVNGTEDLAGQGRPRTYGVCYNVIGQLIDPLNQVYQFHDGEIDSFMAVYDSGVQLTLFQDFGTYAEMRTSSPPPGSYSSCTKEGDIKLGADAVGQVTADVKGDKFGIRTVSMAAFSDGNSFSDGFGFAGRTSRQTALTTAQIVWRILEERAGFSAAEINESAFYRADELQPGQIGFHVDTGTDLTIEDVIAEIARSAGFFIGDDQYGKLVMRRIDVPEDFSRFAIVTDEILSIQQMNLPYGVPPETIRLMFKRNWTPQDDSQIAAGVGATRRASLRLPYRIAPITPDANVLASHPAAGSFDVFTLFNESSAASIEKQRLRQLYANRRMLIQATVKGYMFAIELGDTVNISHNRFGLSDGRFMVCLSVAEDLIAQTTTVILFG